MVRESQPEAGGESGPGGPHRQPQKPKDARLHRAVVGDPERETNQAERAAMHPEGDEDLEWHYYHGAWSG